MSPLVNPDCDFRPLRRLPEQIDKITKSRPEKKTMLEIHHLRNTEL